MAEDWRERPLVTLVATRGLMSVQDHLIESANMIVKIVQLDPHCQGQPAFKKEHLKQALIHIWETMEHLLTTIDDEVISDDPEETLEGLANAQSIIRKNLARSLEVFDE